jgi:hypothetical protein
MYAVGEDSSGELPSLIALPGIMGMPVFQAPARLPQKDTAQMSVLKICPLPF